MRFKGFALLLTVIALASLISAIPTSAWVYQDGTPADTKFETFGPRADRLLMKLNAAYENLEQGLIDMLGLKLTKYWYERWTNPPFNETINVIGSSSKDFLMLDINNANTTASPVYPNPCTVLSFRQAVAHLVDRTWFDGIIGPDMYVPIWVPMPPVFGDFYGDGPNPYPYDPPTAERLLDEDWFPINPATGWRFWDRNQNGIEEPDEYLELKFVIRVDHPHRLAIGNKIADELNNVHVRVNRIYANAMQALIIVIVNRDFHLYTGAYYYE
ncbi:MAG: ABC transporter substrate-binding protein, partial [Candidatus Bathyarchaeia archaeon]